MCNIKSVSLQLICSWGKRMYTLLQFKVSSYQGLNNNCVILTNFNKQTNNLT